MLTKACVAKWIVVFGFGSVSPCLFTTTTSEICHMPFFLAKLNYSCSQQNMAPAASEYRVPDMIITSEFIACGAGGTNSA